ncbi:hypothetical protein [Marinomonas algarum]|uniref:Uncharacterized protein n=1 Tax=Marinomonas algarum TaxID=2883105 RepID=A0A9X1ILL4_9GAMM|nr:hypothetical protein [Marinomonas algarum]MCB5160306.1 hypothetical protein [Marinomonas algarum]
MPEIRDTEKNTTHNRLLRLPIGLFLGSVSVISGTSGQAILTRLNRWQGVLPSKINGSTDGLALFAAIAAMVGFLYPAQSSKTFDLIGFAGAVHLPSAVLLGMSYGLGYWFCLGRGNTLDKRVLSLCVAVYLLCSLVRFWF